MARNSSPLPIRHSNTVPRTPSAARVSLASPFDDEDELAGDTIPCSPAAFLRETTQPTQILPKLRETTQPTQILPTLRDTTQPTQILSKQTLAPLRSSSPPSSVIEVPASSPFQQQPSKPSSTFVNRLAPAGTFFRPPPRTQSSTMPGVKRPAQEPINLISDDEEDDFTPPRGDIQSTTFKAQISEFVYNPESDEREIRNKLRQIYDVYGERVPVSRAREALKANNGDIEDTLEYLQKKQVLQAQAKQKAQDNRKPGRRLISKGAMQAAQTSRSVSRDTSRTLSPNPQTKPTRRRLVQGLRKEASPILISSPPSSDDPLIIDLVDNDKEDAYQAEASPEPEDDEDDRVLNTINTSTIQELAAITGMKESQLECVIDKRPFDDLAKARRVAMNKKPGARKAPRVNIGDTVVDAVEIFLTAVAAIDNVVGKCETDAKNVKAQVDAWDIDVFGHDKRSQSKRTQRQGSEDLPPTPTSITATKYVRPPIPQQPKFMDGHCKMKPFQLVGLNWMSLLYNFNIGCILADEMGLGKTCQVISLMSHLVEKYEEKPTGRRPWPNLVVVPPSTYNNWLGEFERFAPGLSVVGYRGSQTERAEIAYDVEHNPEDYHVVLATYSQICSAEDVEAMRSFNINAAVFDEGHKLKNPETKLYKDLSKIPASWRMLLTGTPVQNNLLEMTALLNFINPEMFRGYMEHIRFVFSQKVSVRDVGNGAFLYSERVKRARIILEPFILQRRKDQVLSDMPPKICSVVHCDMTESQRDAYAGYEEIFKLEPSQRARQARGRQNDQNNCWMQLRKAAIHPLLFRRHFDDAKVEKMAKILMDNIPQSELHQPVLKHLVQELQNESDFSLHLWCRDYPRLLKKYDLPADAEHDSGKVVKLLELVAQYQENGDRVLVFSKFARVIEMLQEVLSLQNIQHRVLMGNTPVSERQTLINEFNEDEEIPVFLLTTGAGGTGINLTAANKVIIFDQSDNPQDDIQAENRAHRLGQKRDVEIIRLISKGTIEELIYKACQKKIELANKVTGAVEDDEAEVAKNLESEVRKMLVEEGMTPP
ncbi:SNF2 family N-terminal domain-containing protein [Thelonectria olida]|uniref:SNF2 family N-terminal domain-containing protein n=1 Tax=Thelonectria olida TaxID=1576542 RepID=A0A9P8WEY8_9HYPO|nr:SNF2 family N-terminal domain-containing protein [Thelonectria olida]